IAGRTIEGESPERRGVKAAPTGTTGLRTGIAGRTVEGESPGRQGVKAAPTGTTGLR
ncbi:hypothetical protein NDU88_002466, partial [Pleurodeles waltl]